MMRQDLFRQEALDFNRDKFLGEVALSQPLSISVLTGATVIIALAVITFAC